MKWYSKIIPLFFLLLLLYPGISHGAWIWTPNTKGWLNPKHAVKDTAKEQFKHAMGFRETPDYKRAISEFNKLLRFYPNSTDAPQAQYYIGRCYQDMEEHYHAYLSYQKVIEMYPYAKNREEIIKREYDIGLLFLSGEKAKVLGVSLLPALDKSIEIFEQIVKNSPYGEYADDAQFKIGEAYKRSNRFAEATEAFGKLLEEHPKSPLKDKANYEIAQCAYLASLGSSYDQTSTDEAIEHFKGFVSGSDGSTLSEEAKKSLDILKNKKAEALYDKAHFYEKVGKNNSAAVYYRELVDNYPQSPLAAESLTRLMEIEKGSKQ